MGKKENEKDGWRDWRNYGPYDWFVVGFFILMLLGLLVILFGDTIGEPVDWNPN